MKMTFNKIDYVMVMVENMSRSIEFYRDVLGLPLKFSSDGWTEFNTGGTTFALHGGAKARPAHSQEGPHSDAAGTCSIGFNVEDLKSTYETLKAKGVKFRLPPTDRPNEGIFLAVAVDPDGLEISLTQVK